MRQVLGIEEVITFPTNNGPRQDLKVSCLLHYTFSHYMVVYCGGASNLHVISCRHEHLMRRAFVTWKLMMDLPPEPHVVSSTVVLDGNDYEEVIHDEVRMSTAGEQIRYYRPRQFVLPALHADNNWEVPKAPAEVDNVRPRKYMFLPINLEGSV